MSNMYQENVHWLQWGQNKRWNRIRMWILQTVFKWNYISSLPPLCIQITSLSAHPQGLITMCLLCILCYKFDFKNLCGTIYLKLYAKYKHTQMCFVKSLNQWKRFNRRNKIIYIQMKFWFFHSFWFMCRILRT